MTEITIHTGGMADCSTIYFDWFDENLNDLKTTVEMVVRNQDKPREMDLFVEGEPVAHFCGTVVEIVEHERAETWRGRAAALGVDNEMLRELLAEAKSAIEIGEGYVRGRLADWVHDGEPGIARIVAHDMAALVQARVEINAALAAPPPGPDSVPARQAGEAKGA
jgi:hypothetical protein